MKALTSHGGDAQSDADRQLDLRSLHKTTETIRTRMVSSSHSRERSLTYCCNHDGIVKETESNEGHSIVEQNCKQALK